MMNLMQRIKKGQSKREPRIMLIGVHGVGKSTAGAAMPNPIFICTENRLVGPQFENIPSFSPEDWDELLQFCDELAQNPGDYKSVVIDTLDWAEPILFKWVCKKYNFKNIEEPGYGKGYNIAQQEARQLISRLEKLNDIGMKILLLCHSDIKTINDPSRDNYDRFVCKMNQKIGNMFLEWCDQILFAEFDMYTKKDGMRAKAFGGDGRIVHTTHSAAWDAKNGYGLPEVMPLDMGAIIDEIMEHINGKISDEDIESLKTEFLGYTKNMKPEIAEKARKWLKSCKWTPEQLAQKVNSYRVKKNINVTEDKKEADNG